MSAFTYKTCESCGQEVRPTDLHKQQRERIAALEAKLAVAREVLEYASSTYARPGITSRMAKEAIAALGDAQPADLAERVAAKNKEIEAAGIKTWGYKHSDARRYERLRILGAAPCGTPELANGTVLRFQSLDAFLDRDLDRYPHRGDAQPASAEVKPEPVAVEAYSYGGATGINDYLMSDGSIKAMRPDEVKWATPPQQPRQEPVAEILNDGDGVAVLYKSAENLPAGTLLCVCQPQQPRQESEIAAEALEEAADKCREVAKKQVTLGRQFAAIDCAEAIRAIAAQKREAGK